MKIAIIDFGAGNLKSISNFLIRNFKSKVNIYESPNKEINNSDLMIIPGVGHFEHAVKTIKSKKLDYSIKDFYKKGKPIIGICLGAQILTKSSEEAPYKKGLGLINAKCLSLESHPTYRENIPRIGWCGIEGDSKSAYYFVHSYYIHVLDNSLKTILSTDGVTASVQNNNIIAMQFHPEKSDISGKEIIKNFISNYV